MIKVDDHAETAVSRLLWQWRRSVKMQAYTRAWIGVLQDVEDALFEILENRNIENAEGAQLDTIGRIVGRGRGGLSDVDYRIGLRVQVRINRASGTSKDFGEVLAISLEGTSLTWSFLEGIASVQITINEPITADQASAIWLNLRLTKSLGVRLNFVYTLADGIPSTPPFVFVAVGEEDPANVLDGFATTTLTSGGQWDNVLAV